MGMIGWIARKSTDLWTGLFLMIFSGAVINEALNLDVGTPAKPGSGFMIFGTAAVLGILALLQFLKALFFRAQEEQASEKINLWRIVAVIGANVLYIVALETVGFLLCTFLLMVLLFQVYEKGKWVWAIGGAAATSLVAYVLFSRLLQLNLPKGLIPFF
jgi:putative tricarboxylic transport membrane protein